MKLGDVVVYKDEIGGGTIVKRDGNMLLIEEESGFSDWVSVSDVLLKESFQVSSIETKPEDKSKSKNASRPHSKNHQSKLEVDLHLHNLTDYTGGMSNHEKVLLQLKAAKNALAEARHKKFKYLHLIHGKGSGKLRQELHHWLAKQNVVDFYDMDISGNRSGVTEVQLF